MRIGDFPLVESLVAARNHLIDLRDEGHISIVIDGNAMTADFVQDAAPAIKLCLRHRIVAIDTKLRELGVRMD